MQTQNKIQHLLFDRFKAKTQGLRFRQAMPYIYGRVLDLGCGSGQLLQSLNGQHHIKDYLGIDKEVMDQLLLMPLIKMDIESSRFDTLEGEYDTIVMLAVLEHLRAPGRVLRNCVRLLAEDGALVLTTPTAAGDKFAKTVFGKGYDHVIIYDERKVHRALAKAGFNTILYKQFSFGLNQLVVATKGGCLNGRL